MFEGTVFLSAEATGAGGAAAEALALAAEAELGLAEVVLVDEGAAA